jgi:hypothetical protein
MVQQFQGERGEVGCGPAANSLDGLHGPAKPGKRGFFRRRGRAAEGGGLLNRYTVNIRIEGSNPSVSAIISRKYLRLLAIYNDKEFTQLFARIAARYSLSRTVGQRGFWTESEIELREGWRIP